MLLLRLTDWLFSDDNKPFARTKVVWRVRSSIADHPNSTQFVVKYNRTNCKGRRDFAGNWIYGQKQSIIIALKIGYDTENQVESIESKINRIPCEIICESLFTRTVDFSSSFNVQVLVQSWMRVSGSSRRMNYEIAANWIDDYRCFIRMNVMLLLFFWRGNCTVEVNAYASVQSHHLINIFVSLVSVICDIYRETDIRHGQKHCFECRVCVCAVWCVSLMKSRAEKTVNRFVNADRQQCYV